MRTVHVEMIAYACSHKTNLHSDFQGEIIYAPPPLPSFLAKRHFSGEGGGGVYSEPPRGRNFIRPPLLHAPHP